MSNSMNMSTRPYLIRAMWEWAADNGWTPQLLVDATVEGVSVPPASVESGRIVLNVHPRAVAELELGNHMITFNGRFSGVPHEVTVPVAAVLAIFARENSQGIFFQEKSSADDGSSKSVSLSQAKDDERPHLRLVE